MSTFTTPPCSRRIEYNQAETEKPGANADNRVVILWLETVLFHGKMIESADSRETLKQLAGNIPSVCFSNKVPELSVENNPELSAVIDAVKDFAEKRIEDSRLSEKADLAIRSIASKFSSSIEVISPNRVFKSVPGRIVPGYTPKAKRRLDFVDE